MSFLIDVSCVLSKTKTKLNQQKILFPMELNPWLLGWNEALYHCATARFVDSQLVTRFFKAIQSIIVFLSIFFRSFYL